MGFLLGSRDDSSSVWSGELVYCGLCAYAVWMLCASAANLIRADITHTKVFLGRFHRSGQHFGRKVSIGQREERSSKYQSHGHNLVRVS